MSNEFIFNLNAGSRLHNHLYMNFVDFHFKFYVNYFLNLLMFMCKSLSASLSASYIYIYIRHHLLLCICQCMYNICVIKTEVWLECKYVILICVICNIKSSYTQSSLCNDCTTILYGVRRKLGYEGSKRDQLLTNSLKVEQKLCKQYFI